ncbi:type III restriction endonuclease subunit R [Paraphotobacterium marinum]|uniref:Type III restriction endonuclease subunit R n=1 Tax=Paraphotobacterium marinum TaxID=1755811 RepID=A0A220VFI4_9GAMM|nr:DEAD/DEAH box helicase family protein [Paraphotobacterium marinum]ASK79125.1 type III restriction endonuclease subunit R [Paraphotobacterium marinum]
MSKMKIHFNPNLNHQKDAVNSVIGIFKGQGTYQSNFSVTKTSQLDLFKKNDGVGVGNEIKLLNEELYENTRKIQLINGLPQTKNQGGKLSSRDFTIEMETGTGKTYVYLRSVFELNKHYGFTKFIVVVPSIAIKEGVYKTLQITEEHFKNEYKNVQYDYFVYDSSKREEVRNFATNDYIQIMVINIDAFSKSFSDPKKENKANLIHRSDDRLNGMKPIEFIQQTNPIILIDEPQSVSSTQNRRKAIESLNPLCTFSYSATLPKNHNLLYKLDSIDAYEQKLVKQIEVASINVKDNYNQAYIKLLSVNNKKSPITARIEIDAQTKTGKLQPNTTLNVKSGSDLFELSGGRSVYEGYIINEIYCEEDNEYIDFTSRDEEIELGQSIGKVDDDIYKRLQISKTIEEHFEKELKFYKLITTNLNKVDHPKVLKKKGIKVLSLFFIDKVANYRSYSKCGKPVKGKYALWFEEEFIKLASKRRYQDIFPDLWYENREGKLIIDKLAIEELVSKVHNGYFAQDKKKDTSGNPQFVDSKLTKGEGGKTSADESAYNLIMKDKEKLLSMEINLRFVFSHSALKEGWDNPNVFQICTLNETRSIIKKRQEIGRGLRLAVDQSGNRAPYGFEVNTLTVMVNESYEEFVSKLQEEIENEEGIKFGKIEKHQFANIIINDGEPKLYLGAENSEEIYNHLVKVGYINEKGKAQELLKSHLSKNIVLLPKDMKKYSKNILPILERVSKKLNIKNHEERQTAKLRQVNGKQVLLGEDFKLLWNKIKYKTTYRVNFDVDKLVKECIKKITHEVHVSRAKFEYKKAKVAITEAELAIYDEESKIEYHNQFNFKLPDIVTYLVSYTNLTRKTIVNILIGIGDKIESFKNNPQIFIELASKVIKNQMKMSIVDGISYHKVGNNSFYAQELFDEVEVTGYLKNMVKANKSIYDYVLCDSMTEENFANDLEKSLNVKLYAKLPCWFKINTPLGSYNPDWAIIIDKNDGYGEHLYFVVETKSSMFSEDLRATEQAKINCGIEHFKALSEKNKFKNDNDNKDIELIKADTFETLTKHF